MVRKPGIEMSDGLNAAWQQRRKELFYPYGKTYNQSLGEQD